MTNGRLEVSSAAQSDPAVFEFCKAIRIFTTNYPINVENGLSDQEITRSCWNQLCRIQLNTTPIPQEVVNRFKSIILLIPLGEKDKVDSLVHTVVHLGQ